MSKLKKFRPQACTSLLSAIIVSTSSDTFHWSGDCIILTGSPTVKVEGQPVARHGSDVGMNNMNCTGKLITLTAPPVEVKDNTIPCNNPPISSQWLDTLMAEKTESQNGTLASLRQSADMGGKIKSLEGEAKGAIDDISVPELGGDGLLTQMANQEISHDVNFLKGLATGAMGMAGGVASLGNMAVQAALTSPYERGLDSLILAENIRLGNVCAAGAWDNVKSSLKAGKDAAGEAWEKYNNASPAEQAKMLGEGVFFVGSMFVGAGEAGTAGRLGSMAGKAGKGAEVASAAGKAGETASVMSKADDVAGMAKAADAAEDAAALEKAKVAEDTSGIKVKPEVFNRSMSQRRKALLRDAKDPMSDLTAEQRKFILDNNGYKVPAGVEVSHEVPVYTAKTVEGKKSLDVAENMKTQPKVVHRARHKVCGDQYHDFPR